MQAFEIRNLSDSEIQTKLEEAYEELFNLRFQKTIGQVKDPNRFTVLKRDIARMKTILGERKRATA
ncbi:MAG: 50S ribosomal protein L29 [Anaerolineae bacterium]|jgi:large subunit ribosomal protein L29|nr:50S ribosomal protein L29 [Anaerolineales bacterium]MCQ3973166.1 50S ribosomal protein L29 [Anaerolineae bacterium]